MIRRPPRSTQSRSSAASDVYKRQHPDHASQSAVAAQERRRGKVGRTDAGNARRLLAARLVRQTVPGLAVRCPTGEASLHHADPSYLLDPEGQIVETAARCVRVAANRVDVDAIDRAMGEL